MARPERSCSVVLLYIRVWSKISLEKRDAVAEKKFVTIAEDWGLAVGVSEQRSREQQEKGSGGGWDGEEDTRKRKCERGKDAALAM